MTGEQQTNGFKRGVLSFAGTAGAGVAVLAVAQEAIGKFDLRLPANVALVLIVGLVGLLAQRARALAAERRDYREQQRAMSEGFTSWPPSSVSKADIFDLGVYPAAGGDAASGYVKRDADAKLAEALESSSTVVVYGPPGSGKSRTALRVLREKRPDAQLLVPESAEHLSTLLSVAPRHPAGAAGAVLWLDGLQRYLDGLRVNALESLVDASSPLQVVATIEQAALRQLLDDTTGAQAHAARRLVARASLVEMPAELSAGEQEAAVGVPAYAALDFSGGFTTAFGTVWPPATQPAPATPPEPAPTRIGRARRAASRPLAWIADIDPLAGVVALAIAAVVAALVFLANREGLLVPAPVQAQLASLRQELKPCGIELFEPNNPAAIEGGQPLLVATDPNRTCSAREDNKRPVLVYSLDHGRLEPAYSFGPPADLLAGGYEFECRGVEALNPCWTDVSGKGDSAVIGGFRSLDINRAVFPLAVEDVGGRFSIHALVTERPSLTRPYDAKLYDRPSVLAGADGERQAPGYYVADFALASSPRDDEDVRAVRFVAGFTPLRGSSARRALELRPSLFGLDRQGHVVLSNSCVLVRPEDRAIVSVPTGRTFQAQLEQSWRGFETGRVARAVCYRQGKR